VDKYCEGKMKRTLERELKDLKPLRRKQCARHSHRMRRRREAEPEWEVEDLRISYGAW